MKNVLSLLLLCSMVLGVLSLSSCNISNKTTAEPNNNNPTTSNNSEGLEFRYDEDGGGYYVTGIGSCTDLDIIIPNEHNGNTVIGINDEAFAENRDITSVVIPEGVLYIEYAAFLNCRALQSVSLPSSLLIIGESAFEKCTSLTSIKIPESVTEIPYRAFACCSSLRTVELHESIQTIEVDAFYMCTAIKRFNVPSSLNANAFSVFYMYWSSLQEFTMSGQSSFLYVEDGNLYYKDPVYDYTFFLAYALAKEDNAFTVPSNVDTIFTGAFAFYPWRFVDVENKGPNELIFYKYESHLKKVIVSEGVSYIAPWAFNYCTDLLRLILPSTISYIDENALVACSRLQTIEFNGTIAEWEAIPKGENWYVDCPITTIKCLDGITQPNKNVVEKETITLWVSTQFGAKELFEKQITKFFEQNPRYLNYKVVIGTFDEGSAANNVLNNIGGTPDIFCFSSDQLENLAANGTLASPLLNVENAVITENDKGSINAASHNGKIYAYPLNISNGFYMYYDKSIITEPSSLDRIIADVEAYNKVNGTDKHISFELSDAWYSSSFFFGAGCESSWAFDNTSNRFTDVNDTFNSEAGLIAMRGIQKLMNSSCFNNDVTDVRNSAVLISGLWNKSAAEKEFGENLGVAVLPSFTVDEKSYQLTPYSEYNLIGIKPSDDIKKVIFLQDLALYLTNEKCQMERYTELGWIPTNSAAQQDEGLVSDIHASALINQSQLGTPKRLIPTNWWSIAGELATVASTATTDDELRAALEIYKEKLSSLIAE